MKKQMKPAVAQSKRTVRNVSEKFYVDICRRVTEAILLTGGDEELAEVAMGVINAYISCGIEPTDDMYVGLRLVFAVLKPELDRAMSRSRKARERARLRRKSDSPAESPAAAEPASPSQPAAPGLHRLPQPRRHIPLHRPIPLLPPSRPRAFPVARVANLSADCAPNRKKSPA